MVEDQHRYGTSKLVGGHAGEQVLLEELIDRVKPPLPDEPAFVGMSYLLKTPFRYPPLRHGSRFGSIEERGIWYGARAVATVLAEVAFYRLLFLQGTAATIAHVETSHMAYAVWVAARRAVDVGRPAFDAVRNAVLDPESHAAGRALGRALREAGAEVVVYPSVRDPAEGENIGVLDPGAFASKEPVQGSEQAWRCATTPERVTFWRAGGETPGGGEAVTFEAQLFYRQGRIPDPG